MGLLYIYNPSLRKGRQENQEFKIIFSYIGASKPAGPHEAWSKDKTIKQDLTWSRRNTYSLPVPFT